MRCKVALDGPKRKNSNNELCSKANQMWNTLKSKLENAWNRQNHLNVVLVNTISSNTGRSNRIEANHLKTFRTIWRLIDLMAFVAGLSATKEVDINARMAFTALNIFLAFVCLFYTMFIVWPSIPLLLEVICIFGVLIPVCTSRSKSINPSIQM